MITETNYVKAQNFILKNKQKLQESNRIVELYEREKRVKELITRENLPIDETSLSIKAKGVIKRHLDQCGIDETIIGFLINYCKYYDFVDQDTKNYFSWLRGCGKQTGKEIDNYLANKFDMRRWQLPYSEDHYI